MCHNLQIAGDVGREPPRREARVSHLKHPHLATDADLLLGLAANLTSSSAGVLSLYTLKLFSICQHDSQFILAATYA